MGFYKLWRSYSIPAGRDQAWKRAILAGLAGWFLQMIVDDQSMVFGEMALVILLVAMLLTFPEKAAPAPRPLSLNLLWLPLAGWLAFTGWSLWGYAPMAQGLQAAEQNDWPAAASLIQQSAQRDPALSFYSTRDRFCLGESLAGQREYDPPCRRPARLSNTACPSNRPSPICGPTWPFWIGRPGQTAAAIQHMQTATRLSPQEPTYLLNLGWFHEDSNDPAAAKLAYLEALQLAPAWAEHPFWQATSLRQALLAEWHKAQPDARPARQAAAWQRALLAVQAGDWVQAQRSLAYARWVGEPAAEIAWVSGQMAEAQGDMPAAIAIYQKQAASLSFLAFAGGNTNSLTYSLWLNNRNGLGFDLVPGYLRAHFHPRPVQAARPPANPGPPARRLPNGRRRLANRTAGHPWRQPGPPARPAGLPLRTWLVRAKQAQIDSVSLN